MDQQDSKHDARLAGAEEIAAQARALCREHDVRVTSCTWDIGADLTHENAHRLEIVSGAKTVRVYFPDPELTSSTQPRRKEKIADRLRRAISQLLTRSPVPTYSNQ